jgi:lysophospholipase L1-like esterase
VGAFRAAIRAVMAVAGPRRCVVWTNIVRPPVAGTSYAGFNHVLRLEDRARGNLRVVNWVRLARENPQWFGPDHVHVTAAGYQVRAQRIATAVRHCR